MKDVIVIGVDHGYAAMKTVHFSFPTGLVEYKQAGNSVTVTVIEAIGRRIRAVDEELRKMGDAA